MKKQSRTVRRPRQSPAPASRHLPLVDILVDTQAELQELVVASGLKVLEAMLEEDRAAVCGPRYARQPERQAYRAGHAPSQVVLGGRKVAIRRVMSDNGSGYVSRRFRAACQALELRHLRTRPYTPQTNGTAERFIQTLLREWAYVTAYPSSPVRRQRLRAYLRYDNQRRPHASLDYLAPASRISSAA